MSRTCVPRKVMAVIVSALLAVLIAPVAWADEADVPDANYQRQYELTAYYESLLPDYDTNVKYPSGLLASDSESLAWDITSPFRSLKKGIEASSIPESYDSRVQKVISTVKDQGSEGCCWAFALCEAAQASYLSNNAGASSLPMIDLSEWQLAFFEYNRPVDDLANTVDDATNNGYSYTIGSMMYYGVGGNPLMSAIGATSGIGFAYEDAADYDVMESLLYSTNLAKLNDSQCYPADSFLVENFYVVDQVEQPSVMKRLIMEKGAGTLFFDSANYAYDFEHNSYYNPEDSGTGHIIAVVGWDDNYPKENFLTPAEHDGAWLCKNSWGEEWGDDGYFWMSYDEPSLEERLSIFLDIVDNTSYDHAYYYDGTTSPEMIEGFEYEYEYEANIFTAKQNETVKALSFFTTESNTDYEVCVYKNVDPNDPMSGTCVLSGVSGSIEIPGYHMVTLSEGQYFDVDAGETFAVVVHETCEGAPTSFYIDASFDYNWVNGTSSFEAGQSFASADGTEWDDLSVDMGNLRVRAFTTVRPGGEVSSIAFEQDSYEVAAGSTANLKVLSDGRVINDEQVLSFVSSNSDVLRVDARGNIYPCKTGEVTVTVMLGSLEAMTTVTVTAPNVTAITKPEGYATEDEPLEVTANEKSGYTLRYSMENGRGLQPRWTYEDLSSDSAEYDYSPLEIQGNGVFKAYREGLYKVTASYENASGTTVSQDFFMHVSLDVTEFTDENLIYINYDNLQTKVFMYTGELSDDGYIFTFDDASAFEKNYDYLYLLADNVEFSAQDAYDAAAYHNWQATDYRCEYTGDQLAGATLVVPYKYVAFVFISDTATTDYGFSLTSLSTRVAINQVILADSYYDEDFGNELIEMEPGETLDTLEYTLLPENTTDKVAYSVSNNDIVTTNSDGVLYAKGIGLTRVEMRVDLGNGIPGDYLEDFYVHVESDDEPVIRFANDGPISIARNSYYYGLELEETPWAPAVYFESSNPVVAQIDYYGDIQAYSVGTTTIKACYNGEVYDTIEVNVYAPDMSTMKYLDVYRYVAGMHEAYEYSFPGAEIIAFMLSSYDLYEGDTVTIYDGNGTIVGGPYTGYTDYSYDGTLITIEDDSFSVVLDSTGSVSEDRWAGTMYYGGLTIRNIVAGKMPTGIASIPDYTFSLTESGGNYYGNLQIPITVEPEDALLNLHASYELVSEGGFLYQPSIGSGSNILYLRAYGEGEAIITVWDDYDHSVSFHVTATTDSVPDQSGKPVTSLDVLDGDGALVPDTITLKVGETRSLPLVVEPDDTTEHVGANVVSTRVCSAFVYDTDDGQVLFLKGLTEGTTLVRVKTESQVWRTLTVTVQDEAGPIHEHSYTAVVTDPTCTEQGFTTHTCSCGDFYIDTYTPALGHTWGEGVVTIEPTLEAEGVMTYTCTVCSEKKTEAIPKLIDISGAEVTLIPDSAVYTGEIITFEIKVVLDGVELVRDVDYSIPVEHYVFKDVGTYTFNVYGDGKYGGMTPDVTFEILPAPNSFTFFEMDGEATITGYNGTATELVIPEEVGGWPVVAIADGAFSGMTELASVTIPSFIWHVGQNAFSDCPLLTSAGPIGSGAAIEFGWTDVIPDSSFIGMTQLTSVIIPDGMTVIGNRAFEGCSSLMSVTLPASVVDFRSYAFNDCTSLASLTIPGELQACDSNAFTNLADPSVIYVQSQASAQLLEGKYTEGRTTIEVATAHVHNFEPIGERAPKCTEDGMVWYKCYGCGETREEVIPATGHIEVIDAAVVPTCTEPGLTEGKHCRACGEVLVAQETVPAFGHTWGEGVVTVEPTTEAEGVMTYTCTVCGAEMTEAIPKIVELPVKTDGTKYRIVSASDRRFILDVAEVIPTIGANVSIWTSNGGENQLFTFKEEGGYVIPYNVANPELVLDAAGAKPSVGANVSTWSFNNGMNQKWSLIPSADMPGFYSIASASDPTYVLDAAGAVPEIGANVSIWYSNGGLNQLWTFVEANDLAYAEVAAVGMSRNYTGGSLSPDISVTLNDVELSEGEDYEVYFGSEKSEPSEPGCYAVLVKGVGEYSGTVELGDFCIYDVPEAVAGVQYHLASGFSDDFVLDVAEVMPTIGANVSIWIDNSGDNQLFTMELLDDGFYALRNVANPELVLDAAGAEPSVGANVSTWSLNGGMNQKWVLLPSDEMPGYYRIASASNTYYVLDAAGAAPEIGANVSIWYDNGGLNQLWKLVPTETEPSETAVSDM